MKQTINRLKEIFVWNTCLTKLFDQNYFKNADEFLSELIQIRGPFIEKILPPELWPDDWETLCQETDIHPIVRDVVAEIIFNDDVHKKPYYHQGLSFKTLAISNKELSDSIITAPTATGKTECFLIPILDFCVKDKIANKENSLKAIIIYPMKTLEADQLNRIIRYLYGINEKLRLSGFPPVTVGIWDGDTPISPSGENEEDVGSWIKLIEGQSVRGLECPKHKKKLVWKKHSLGCEEIGCFLPWIYITRNDIRSKNVDILITNPEALEFALLSPYNKKFLPPYEKLRKVKYIVFDEAHVWSGTSATSLSVLIQRLRHFYRVSRPVFILSSATISNPKEFASKLLLINEAKVNHVDFKERIPQFSCTQKYQLYNIKPCKFNVILGVLFIAENYSKNVPVIIDCLEANGIGVDLNERRNALEMCEKLGLIRRADESIELTDDGRYLVSTLKKYSIESFNDNRAFELFDNSDFLERWAFLIQNKVPEIYDLLSVFGDRDFVHEKMLIAHVREKANVSFEKASEIVATLLNWGRAGNFLLDKYHYFIKPVEHIYWCPKDNVLSSKKICPKCGGQILELRFCNRCHEPFIVREGKIEPLRKNTRINGNICQCGRRLDLETMATGSISYLTFITFLLSALTRSVYHRKVLVFSDSRGEVEAITTFTRSLDYSLVLHREACKIILETLSKDGLLIKRLHERLKSRATEIYYKETPFDIDDEDLKPMRSQYFRYLYRLSQIYGPNVSKGRHGRLFISAILSFGNIYEEFSIPLEIAIAHYILFEVGYEQEVLYKSVPRKVRKYFYNFSNKDCEKFKNLVQNVVERLVQKGILDKRKNSNGQDVIGIPDVWEHKYRLIIPEQVSYCENCYLGYPTILEECPNCGSSSLLNKGSRYTINEENGKIILKGGYFENLQEGIPYVLDHWAKEILGPAISSIKDRKVNAIFIADHRSGLPAVMRARLEEGFRASPPTVNVICCTPTMELGIDIGTLNCACMIGIPPTKTNYIQRTGRTGRTIAFPSLLITIIRNEHSVDNHYLSKVDEYLNRKSEVLKVPPFTETIIKQHIVSITLQFLNDVSQDYENEYYSIFPFENRFAFTSKKKIEFLEKILSRKLKLFFEDVLNRYSELTEFVCETLGKTKVPFSSIKRMLNELFLGDDKNPPEVIERISYLVRSYVELYNLMSEKGIDTGGLMQNFLDSFSCLSLCLSQPRLLADYRGIMRSIPVAFTSKRFKHALLELKTIDNALREAFPGFVKDERSLARGALLRQQGIEYDIIDVKTIDKALFEVEICTNEKCILPFQSFPKGTRSCPLCGRKLDTIRIYPFYGALAHSKMRSKLVNTTPIISILVPPR